MRKFFKIAFFTLLVFGGTHSYAQKRDTVAIGAVEGVIRDSVRNYIIKSATVSIYRDFDSKLLSYQLSSAFGRFNFKNLPVESLLKVVVTYIGYKQLIRKFSIHKETPSINLQALNVDRSDVQLDEVVITAEPPPVIMKGDTIEFNASAFKLDTNAVVGDLLKKLPGIMIWGDGLITFNGKKINQVLVEGKPFVSDDPQIALKNLPKNAVEKIQIYKTVDAFNPDTLNAPTNLNILLKKA